MAAGARSSAGAVGRLLRPLDLSPGQLAMTDPETHDVVVGSGVTGAITAWKLAQDGHDVLMLDAGETGPERVELVGAYARALQRSPGAPYKGRAGDRFAPDPETSKGYYQFATETKYASTYLRRVGGTTWHFLG